MKFIKTSIVKTKQKCTQDFSDVLPHGYISMLASKQTCYDIGLYLL